MGIVTMLIAILVGIFLMSTIFDTIDAYVIGAIKGVEACFAVLLLLGLYLPLILFAIS